MTRTVTAWPLHVWRWSLACFILAAGSGALIRFGLLHGFPAGLLFGDVRHAHSHLMFFGWGTPVLMLLLLRYSGDTGSRAARLLLGFTLFAALASYLPFLLSGYRLLSVFGRELPLSMMTAGLNGVAWLAFMIIYWLRARTARTIPAGSSFTAAILLLLAASIGVSLLAVAGVTDAGSLWINALAMFYVEIFAEGWFGIALLGLAYAQLAADAHDGLKRPGLVLLAGGLLARSTASVLVGTGTAELGWLVYLGSAAAGTGLLICVLPLWPALARLPASLWHLSIALLSAKGVFDLLLAVPVLAGLSDAAGLRVFYLHAFLLGAFSLGMVAAATRTLGRRAFRYPWLFSLTVLVMLTALLPISGAWPAAWAGRWGMELAAWTSLGPVAVALLALVMLGPAGQPGPDTESATQPRS